MQFIGGIEFIGSNNHNSRETNPADFDTISEWFRSVKEFHTQQAACGDYDGREIIIRIYARPFRNSDEMLIAEYAITNLYAI